jgi:tripartite-type tricarboxylate transporter receptor subunit TctC
MAGLKLLHVPYRGDAAATTALLSGEVFFTLAPATAVEPHIRSGRLRALAITGPQRWLGMPEVPTVAEQGVPGYDVRSWAGWMLPANAPAAAVNQQPQGNGGDGRSRTEEMVQGRGRRQHRAALKGIPCH